MRLIYACSLIIGLMFGLAACGGGGDSASEPAAAGVSIGGSAGDGPIINGLISVTDQFGNLVNTIPANPKTDANARFSFIIPASTAVPITITISGGTDIVTNSPQDFPLQTTVSAFGSTPQITANANPLSTLVVEAARKLGAGSLSRQHIDTATQHLMDRLSFGFPSGSNPITTVVDASNAAAIVKSSEALAELIRRCKQASGRTYADTLKAIAEDVADGGLDGQGVSSGALLTSPQFAAMLLIQQARIAAELIANNMRITSNTGGTVAAASHANFSNNMNAALAIIQPGISGQEADISRVDLDLPLLIQASTASHIANQLLGGSNINVQALRTQFDSLQSGISPTAAELAAMQAALNNADTDLNNAAHAVNPTSVLADTVPPRITAPLSIQLEATALLTPVVLGVANVTDNKSTGLIATPSQTGPFAIGRHKIIWTSIDAAGNKGQAKQIVIIRDTTAPNITLSGGAQINHAHGAVFAEPGVSANDIVDGNVNVSISGNINTDAVGTYTLTYTATDNHQNSTVVTRDISTLCIPSTRLEANRLLQQASFGWSMAQLNAAMAIGSSCWIKQQLQAPSAYDSTTDALKTHVERTIEIAKMADPATHTDSVQNYAQGLASTPFNQAATGDMKAYHMAAWYESAITGQDQLRQRIAYAMSQLEVVSSSEAPLGQRGEALAYYYDILAKHALGNYRTMLLEMAKSPAMGIFLSHQGNRKTNTTTNIRPDENFAREIMQLFTIGLYLLNPDGTRQLDANNNPLPAYTQTDVEEAAKVMTGWDLVGNSWYGQAFNNGENYMTPMEFTPAQHEMGSKTILGKTIADDGNGGDLTAIIDMLFNHPNTGPFLSRHLIKHMVTSNPSPAYIQSVAAVFDDNGSAVRGDLAAVAKAILTHDEARGNSYLTQPNFGKASEPLLAHLRVLKAFNIAPLDGWLSREGNPMTGLYWYRAPENDFSQAPLRSFTVFNFYDAEFIPSDAYFSANKLIAPELQIQTVVGLANFNNEVWQAINNNEKNFLIDKYGSLNAYAATRSAYNRLYVVDFDTELALMEQAIDGDSNGDFIDLKSTVVDANGDTPRLRAIDALLAHLNTLMFGDALPAAYFNILRPHLNTILYGNNPTVARHIIREAVQLLSISSEFKIQK